MVNSARKYMRHILFMQGVLTVPFAFTWIFDATSGRLAGIAWLETVMSRVTPLSTDVEVGILWLVSAIAMILGGSRLGVRWRRLESLGFVLGAVTPIAVGLVFLAGFIFGGAPNGYITLISYAMFSVPYFAYVHLQPEELAETTAPIVILGETDDAD